jgi:hypothetical protein
MFAANLARLSQTEFFPGQAATVTARAFVQIMLAGVAHAEAALARVLL